MRFKKGDLVIWQDEELDDITGTIVEVNSWGFRVEWDGLPDDSKTNVITYRWSYLDLVTPRSGLPVIRLDHSRIRNVKLEKIGI